MSTPDLENQLLRFINDDILNQSTAIDRADELLLSGLVDSISIMRLVSFIENRTGQPVPPGDITIENFSSVDRIISYLQKSVNSGGK